MSNSGEHNSMRKNAPPPQFQALPPDFTQPHMPDGNGQMELQNVIEYLDESVRLVRSFASWGAGGTGQGLRLEVFSRSGWAPIVSYEILHDRSFRHEYSISGHKRTLHIELPLQAVQQMAENDLTSNWRRYAEFFLAGRSLSD
jgi:hypothetical protein